MAPNQPHNDNSSTSNTPGDGLPADASDAPIPPSQAKTPGSLLFAFVGLLSGAVAWAAIEPLHDVFKRPPALVVEMQEANMNFSDDLQNRIDASKRRLRFQNTALTVGLLGLSLAGLLGLCGGRARRSAGGAIAGLLSGIMLGAALGALGGCAAVLVEESLYNPGEIDNPFHGMAKHAAAWSFVGIAVGLTIGIPDRRVSPITRPVFAAVAAGLVAALVFVPVSTFLFPNSSATPTVPTGTLNRLLWTMLAAGLIGLAAGRQRSRDASGPVNA